MPSQMSVAEGNTRDERMRLPHETVTESAARRFVRLRECQELIRPWLNRRVRRTFWQLTGLQLHVLWYDPLELLPSNARLVLCPAAIHRRKTGGHIPVRCRHCLEQPWNSGVSLAHRGRTFAGRCGARNFGMNLQVGEVRVLTLVVQTLPAGTPTSDHSQDGTLHGAIAMLRLILHDLEATVRACLLSRELESSRLKLKNLAIEDNQLRRVLHQRAPAIAKDWAAPVGGSHSEQIVQRMMEYLHTHYQRPFQLTELADSLKMNACYLSSLFSRTLGVTFHDYLDQLRLAKAKDLLRDPGCRACEVACMAGYANADSFRRAFRTNTGMAPSVWRDEHGGEGQFESARQRRSFLLRGQDTAHCRAVAVGRMATPASLSQ
jgi:AraC-like DNA-binding protein